MENNLPIEAERFKELRKKLGYTQATFAQELEIKSSTIDIERGKMRLPAQALIILMKKYGVNPLWLYGESEQMYNKVAKLEVLPKVIVVDSEENENVLMVNAKAAAGYPSNLSNHQWYTSLPAFHIPLPSFKGVSIRAFQVEGHSMLPILKPNDWVFGKAVLHLDSIKEGDVYVVVSSDSVLVKRVYHKSNQDLVLISENKEYPDILMAKQSVQEMWHFASKMSFDLEQGASRLTAINDKIDILLKEIKKEEN
ncbi:MAG: phage repressor protein C with HTH and peptisase S24 domain [Chitinophagales bacterium]|jgi:phage repressor protein C with HTH and peptisase S24 domain